MNLKEMKDAHQAKLDELVRLRDKSTSGDISSSEFERARTLHSEAMGLQDRITKAEQGQANFARLSDVGRIVDGLPVAGSYTGSKGAPPLEFAEGQLHELHEKTLNRESYSVLSKAAINSTDAPQAQIPYYVPTPFPYLREQTRVIDHIPTEPTDRPFIDYYVLSTPASGAATVAEGDVKPTSSPVFSPKQAVVRKIAHVSSATDETISDFPQFMNFIGAEMLSGLLLEENHQLLNGDGVGTNILGLNNTVGILTRAKGSDTALDALAKAMTDVRVGSSFVEPDVVILHPTDFQSVRLAKSTQGEYLAADPLANQSQNIWGVKVVVTTQQPVGKALIANLSSAAKAYVREPARIQSSLGGALEFTSNIQLLRCEERLALTVIRPTSICQVTGL
jgi:HK97 family phage major capsid protein